jgi:hypothetical protein
MLRKVLFALVLLSCPCAYAADLKIPEKLKGEVGDFIPVKADTTATVVKWVVLDDGIKLFPVDLLRDTKTVVVLARKAGTYRLLAYTGDKDGPSDPLICTITIGNPAPPTPPPGPPGPTDPLTQVLSAAYQADPGTTKEVDLQTLAGVFHSAATLARDSSIKTVGDLYAALKKASSALPDTSLLDVRRAISVELMSKLPSDTSAQLDLSSRSLASAQFSRMAAILDSIK